MVTQSKFIRKFSAVLAGTLLGAFFGYLTDQSLTHFVLQHAENIPSIIITNALSAFLVLPLFIILGAYIGYRLQKK